MLTLDDMAEFTWAFGLHFFLEVGEKGNFVWSCPSYGGDNTIIPYAGSWENYQKEYNLEVGRDKGFHTIRDYCGENVKILL